MGRLTFDIPDAEHRKLKALAAVAGVTIRDFILSRLSDDLKQSNELETKRNELIASWEKRRKELKLKRGDKSFREIIHEGHK